MSKDKFYEKLKDPTMAAVRATVSEMVNDSKNTITKVTYDQYAMYSNEIKVTIELIIPDNGQK